MDAHTITISLQDDSPGYEISPARVPLAILATFAGEVRDFLKGSAKDGEADSTEVAVVSGSLAIAAPNFRSPSLVHDLLVLASTSDLVQIDAKRALSSNDGSLRHTNAPQYKSKSGRIPETLSPFQIEPISTQKVNNN